MKEIMQKIGEKAEALYNIRLCDLNDNNRKIYENVRKIVREERVI